MGPPSGHKYYCVESSNISGRAAIACVMPYDERFYVGDKAKDGYQPAMVWESSSHQAGKIYHSLGHPKWAWRNKSYAESTKIKFKACLRETTYGL